MLLNEKNMKILMFRAKKKTNRFNLNQRVFVSVDFANHAKIRFKYRGSGRYVNGVIPKFIGPKWNKVIGDEGFKEIEVDESFGNRILGI